VVKKFRPREESAAGLPASALPASGSRGRPVSLSQRQHCLAY